MGERQKAGPAKGEIVETRNLTYLAAGVGVTPDRGEPKLDPELAKIRDEEIKANDKVQIDRSFREPSIDPNLVKARKAELERDAKRAGVKLADTSAGKAEKKAEPEPVKKSASSKSDK
jgi:hypothetical protein